MGEKSCPFPLKWHPSPKVGEGANPEVEGLPLSPVDTPGPEIWGGRYPFPQVALLPRGEKMGCPFPPVVALVQKWGEGIPQRWGESAPPFPPVGPLVQRWG